MSGGHRIKLGSWFPPSTMWILGDEPGLAALAAGPLTHRDRSLAPFCFPECNIAALPGLWSELMGLFG